ncbi:MAG: hypothetical protein AAGF87_12920 [Bacteroidota bacterium]
MKSSKLALLVILALFTSHLFAQGISDQLLQFNQQNIDHQRTAMLALGGWAVANIGIGLGFSQSATGENRYFHQMNALWNTVNLAIAGFGYWSISGTDPASWDLATGLAKHQNFQKILLFNAGLDVGYILGGLYLQERSRRPDVNSDRLRGFGKAIVLQGGFLMVFDLVNYFIANGRSGDLDLRLGAVGNGVGMILNF